MKNLDAVWKGWQVEELLGEGSYGKVYKIVRKEFGHTYESALKVIRIPQSRAEEESVRSEGMSEEGVIAYFRGMVEDIVEEFTLMAKLRGNSNIVSYEDHSVVELEDEFGWEIFIRMELLKPLQQYLKETPLTRGAVIRMGIDLCQALEVCQRYNIIHRDIKPENIFYSEQGYFKLGDFGIARQMEKTTSGLSRKGTFTYMAPEVFRSDIYTSSVDLYSLGIVLYRYLNDNRTPFLPPYPQQIRYYDREQATVRRLSGENMPLPCNAQDALGGIVLRACAFDPQDRFEGPQQMREALQAVQGPGENQVLRLTEDMRKKTDNATENSGEGVPEKIQTDTQSELTLPQEPEATLPEEATLTAAPRIKTPKPAPVRPEIANQEPSEQKPSEQEAQEQDLPGQEHSEADVAQQESRRRRFPLIIAAAAVLMIALIAGWFGYSYFHHTVPSLAGMSAEQAESALQEAGLSYHEESREFSDQVARGDVLDQSVSEGEKVKKGTVVDVVISKGTPIDAPDLSGKSVKKAKAAAEKAGLALKVTGKEYSDTVKKGAVISQDPAAGEICEADDIIHVTKSRGIEQVKVPDVTGKSEAKAEKALKKAKLKSETEYEYSSSVEAGNVIRQSEKAGSQIDKNSAVTIVISSGPQPVVRSSGGSSHKSSGRSSGGSSKPPGYGSSF